MGGDIALLIAQRLQAENEEVAQLVIIETYHPDYFRPLSDKKMFKRLLYKIIERFDYESGNLRSMGTKAKLVYLSSKIYTMFRLVEVAAERMIESILKRFNGGFPHSLAYKLYALYDIHTQAYDGYRPKPYDGRVAIFRTRKQPLGLKSDPTLGWGELMKGKLELYEVPGHFLNIFADASIKILAEKLAICLKKVQGEYDSDRQSNEISMAI